MGAGAKGTREERGGPRGKQGDNQGSRPELKDRTLPLTGRSATGAGWTLKYIVIVRAPAIGALAGVAQRAERWPANQRVTS